MTFVTIVYVLLFLGFALFAAFIARLTSRYGYLAPRFKYVLAVFTLIALALIGFSLYLLIQLYRGQSPTRTTPMTPPTRNINF